MITGIRNARLVMPDGVRAGQALYFENGVITAITGRFCVIGSKMNEDALKELFGLE